MLKFSIALFSVLIFGSACTKSKDNDKADVSGDGPLYLVTTNISTTEGSTELIFTPKELTTEALDLNTAIKIPGGATADYYNGNIYLGASEKKEVQRYEVTANGLEARESLSFADRGVDWIDTTYISAERAFTFSSTLLQYIEWNPTTMTITKTHDFSALKKTGWGWEWRDSFYRASDAKIFFYFAYTNQRTSFINEFTVGVFDTKTDQLKILTDSSCPSTAGFGGYIDENNDFYAFADNFGLFTQVGAAEVKKACVLRIKSGESDFDPSYRYLPTDSLDGKAPWGYYYLGQNLVYTSVVDVANNKYDSIFGLLFAPVHPGVLIDTKTSTAIALPDLPISGVGFQPYGVDNALLVSRTSGTAKDNDGVENADTIVYRISSENGTGTGKAEALFHIPGFVGTIQRIR